MVFTGTHVLKKDNQALLEKQALRSLAQRWPKNAEAGWKHGKMDRSLDAGSAEAWLEQGTLEARVTLGLAFRETGCWQMSGPVRGVSSGR
jgi:hypothetical protein